MQFYEILLIIAIISFVVFIFGRQIYKKIKNKPSDDCACCSMKGKRMLKEIRSSIEKEKKCSCNK